MNKISIPLDSIGIIAGSLCTIHCIATPFLFIAKACSATCCSEAPLWWKSIDYAFLIISFLAIFFINKTLTVRWLKISFWVAWFVLFFTILNESINIIEISKNFIYIPSTLIVILHLYNLQFCKCTDQTCCTNITH